MTCEPGSTAALNLMRAYGGRHLHSRNRPEAEIHPARNTPLEGLHSSARLPRFFAALLHHETLMNTEGG